MSRFKNSKKTKHLKAINRNLSEELNAEFSKMGLRSKFNFSYLETNQEKVADFNDFSHSQLLELITKIKEFTKQSLNEWKQQNKLNVYGEFPKKTKLKHPTFVPQGVEWGTFRIEGDFRLAGFVIPHNIAANIPDLDANTFYVVFLDVEHNFYVSQKKHT